MNLKELAEDLWERFCKLDDNLQVIWLEEFADRRIRIVHRENLNEYFDSIYHGDYLAFRKRLKECVEWEDYAFDSDKKWFIDYIDCEILEVGNTLAIPAYFNTVLLENLKEKAFCEVLGYTEKETEGIQLVLKASSAEEIKETWEKVMEPKAYAK